MQHGLKDIAFCVQKHITPCTVVITPLLVRDKQLGASASVKRVYLSNITENVRPCVLCASRKNYGILVTCMEGIIDLCDLRYIGHFYWSLQILPRKPWKPIRTKTKWRACNVLKLPWYQGGADRTQVGPMLAPWTLLSGLAPWFARDSTKLNIACAWKTFCWPHYFQ